MFTPDVIAHPVLTDLTVRYSSSTVDSTNKTGLRTWHWVRELLLQGSPQEAWLGVALTDEKDLAAEDLVITHIRVGERPSETDSGGPWESRPCGIWLRRSKFSGEIDQAVTGLDVLFGEDAVDPRPQWTLMQSPLQLDARSETPVARLSVLYGRAGPRPDIREALEVKQGGTYKIVQISDAHMSVGVRMCTDAIDADGRNLPDIPADPRTVDFIGHILDEEKPDLVVLTGDQLHHDIFDSQSALFKVVAPIINRKIPFAAVFGNHDSEGAFALSRNAQMSILQDLPYSLCEAGPEEVAGVGNFFLQIRAPAPSNLSVATLYFFDSHGQKSSKTWRNDYDHIDQTQINWFIETSQTLRSVCEEGNEAKRFCPSLAFFHIPLPEFGNSNLCIRGGSRGEPTEGPRFNSHLYEAFRQEGVAALCCGHDHVNDFCALLPPQAHHDGAGTDGAGPYLCYGGAVGFGGYGGHGSMRFHRRARVLEIDTSAESLKTWKRVEYANHRVDEMTLVKSGAVVDLPLGMSGERVCVAS